MGNKVNSLLVFDGDMTQNLFLFIR